MTGGVPPEATSSAEEKLWPTALVVAARILGVAALAALLYGLAHLGYVVFGHGHHSYKLPLIVVIVIATLIVGLLWWFRTWQDVFLRNYYWDVVFFVLTAIIPSVVVLFL
jgi:hypothetical protein